MKNRLSALMASQNVFAWCAATAVLIVVVAMSLIVAVTVGAEAEEAQPGSRLITLYDNGAQKGILTSADTLREAFDVAGIYIDEHDLVEPGLDEELVASSYEVNVYRARPVTVVDGSLRHRIISPYQTPAQLADQADLALHDEDETTLQLSDDVLGLGSGIELIIERATEVKVELYGENVTLRTQADTVGAFLEEKDIILGEADEVRPGSETEITPGLEIAIWREGTQTITVEEEVDFTIEEIRDADREQGYREVRTPGEKGARTATYEITIRNGEEVERKEINAVVTKQPTKQVVVVGTKLATMPYTGGGNKDTWLAASNIPRDQWGNADWLVQKESGWNPNAVNASSGACGLGQQLPCGKWAGQWNNPVDSLNGMHGYVMGRYGSWEAAIVHSQARGWY